MYRASFAAASAARAFSVFSPPTTGKITRRTVPDGSDRAASATRSSIASLSRTFFSSAPSSLSTFRSARVMIFSTSWMNRSTSESVISVWRTWHSVASSVRRRGGFIRSRFAGYSFDARARQASTSFSDTSANRSAGSSRRRTRSSLFTSASRLSRPGAPGSVFSSVKCDRPPPTAAPSPSTPCSVPSPVIRSSSRQRVAWLSRSSESRFSKSLTALPTSRRT